ncbi:MAG: phytoene synthase, partial [Pseudomonadota bacterium]
MWTAARLLGTADETVVRDFAYGVGVANIFQAVPALTAQSRQPLIDGSDQGIKTLAAQGLERLDAARTRWRDVSKTSAAALTAGYHARPVLRIAKNTPERVRADALDTNPARDSLRFLNVSLRGWWR